MLRRSGPLLMLREPALAYGPAALVMLYAVGLMAVLWAVTGFARIDAAAATALALPAGAATAATALAVGTRLRRYQETTRYGLVLKVMGVWAFFGAAWPIIHLIGDIIGGPAHANTFDGLFGLARTFAMQAGAGAVVGAIGGLAGALAGIAFCVEARR